MRCLSISQHNSSQVGYNTKPGSDAPNANNQAMKADESVICGDSNRRATWREAAVAVSVW